MAQNLTVKPAYLNNTQVMIDGVLTLLTNNLTQAQLLAIWQKPEYNSFIAIEYVNVQDSFPENFQIDPNLFNAYDSGQITHDKTKTNYPVNTTGAALNEARAKVDNLSDGFIRPNLRASFSCDFANGKFIDPALGFYRNSVGTYVDHAGVMRIVGVNKARFTHDWITSESLGLLYEDVSTNLITNSEGYPGSQPTTTVETVSHNRFAGINVRKITCVDNNDPKVIIAENVGTLGSRTFTMSIYLWTNEAAPTKHYLRLHGSTGIEQLVEKQIEVTNVPTLFTVTKTFVNAISTFINVRFDPFESDALAATGRVLYTAGFQLEEKEIATSYIPTNGTRITRNPDIYSVQSRFSQLFGDCKRGVMYMNFRAYGKNVVSSLFKVSSSDDSRKTFIAINTLNSTVYAGMKPVSGVDIVSTPIAVALLKEDVMVALNFNKNTMTLLVNGVSTTIASTDIPDYTTAVFPFGVGITVKTIAYYPDEMSLSMLKLLTTKQVSGSSSMGMSPANSDLSRGAYTRPEAILRTLGRQEFSIDGTGASITRNIRRPYDFYFELVDTTGYTALTSQPPATLCSANTDYPLTVTLPVGKTLTYAIVPNFEN